MLKFPKFYRSILVFNAKNNKVSFKMEISDDTLVTEKKKEFLPVFTHEILVRIFSRKKYPHLPIRFRTHKSKLEASCFRTRSSGSI